MPHDVSELTQTIFEQEAFAAIFEQVTGCLPCLTRCKALAHSLHVHRDAALYNERSIYELCLKGIAVLEEELEELEVLQELHRWVGWKTVLFSKAGFNRERQMQTRGENEKLDRSINSCLVFLGFFIQSKEEKLREASFQVVEYLVRHFNANLYNAEALLSEFLLLHEQRIFLKLVRSGREIVFCKLILCIAGQDPCEARSVNLEIRRGPLDHSHCNSFQAVIIASCLMLVA